MKNIFVLLGVLLAAATVHAQENESTYTSDQSDRQVSRGGFFVEPLFQLSRQDSSIETSQLGFSDTSGNTQGWGAGLKLGAHVSEIFFIGVDGRYDKLKLTDSSYGEATGDAYNIGPTIGLATPILGIRVMGTYVAAGEYNPQAGSNNVDLKFRDPYGWRLGAGIHILAVSLNLEYQDLKYRTTDVESFGPFPVNTATNVDYENKGYQLSLSFPIEL